MSGRCAEVMRHGQTERAGFFGSTEIGLTEFGGRQLWQAVAGRCWDAIYTSPLRRCAAFAEALAAGLAVGIHPDPRLSEMHFGAWEGRSAEALMACDADHLARFWQNPLAHPPAGAESLTRLRARVLSFWRDLAARKDVAAPLVLTHGGPIRILLAERDGVALDRLMEIEVPHAVLYRIPLNIGADVVDGDALGGELPCGRC